jgi:hypothetical protein
MAACWNRSWPAPILLAALLALAAGCDGNNAPDDAVQHPQTPEIARVVAAEEALANAEVAKLHPATMNEAQIRRVVGDGSHCVFRYTRSGKPVLAFGAQADGRPLGGVVMLNGNLIELDAAPMEGREGLRLDASPIRIAVMPDPGEGDESGGVRIWEADMVFEVGESRRVGYRGYLGCDAVAQPR